MFQNFEKARKKKAGHLSSTDIINKGINLNKFDENIFFEKVDNLDIQEFKEYCEKKQKKYRKNFFMIKELVILILKVTKNDLIDIPFYLKLVKLFLKNKTIKRKIVIDEFRQIKEVPKIYEIIDINKIKLSKDELLFLKDYLYYTGFWNKKNIIDKEIFGMKIEYKLLYKDSNHHNIEEYEPTEMEQEDLTLPSKILNNFDLGDLVLEYIESKYSNIPDSNIHKNSEKLSKWFYIPYKLSLIGPSLIGNKYVAQQVNNKYPNLKIYSVHKILKDLCTLYKKLNEPEEKVKKGKSKKGTTVEDKKKQLEELQPIFNIIKPFLEQEEKKEKNNAFPNDDILLKLLIYQIEKDFPLKTRKEVIEEIKDHSNKINNLLDKIEEIKNNLEENNEEKDKEKKGKEKEKEKSKKKTKKDKVVKEIEYLEKEIENIKLGSIKGFLLIDFPNNINQCYILENYLTGYENETNKPKSLKNKEIQTLSDIIDIKYGRIL